MDEPGQKQINDAADMLLAVSYTHLKWTYSEFMDACKKLQDSGVAPFANSSDLSHGEWLFRPAMLSETVSAGSYDQYINLSLIHISPIFSGTP